MIKSPCIGICDIDDGTKWCIGCLRTLEEIAKWHSMGDEARLEVLRLTGVRNSMLNGDFS